MDPVTMFFLGSALLAVASQGFGSSNSASCQDDWVVAARALAAHWEQEFARHRPYSSPDASRPVGRGFPTGATVDEQIVALARYLNARAKFEEAVGEAMTYVFPFHPTSGVRPDTLPEIGRILDSQKDSMISRIAPEELQRWMLEEARRVGTGDHDATILTILTGEGVVTRAQ